MCSKKYPGNPKFDLFDYPRFCHGEPMLQFTQYSDVIMSMMASQITNLMIVYSIIYSGTDQRKHQSSASLAFVGGIHRWPVNSLHKGPATQKMFPFDEVIMYIHTWVDLLNKKSPKGDLNLYRKI